MSIKYLAIGSLLALGFASPAMADVNQTVTGIQQSDQFQYAEGNAASHDGSSDRQGSTEPSSRCNES